MWYKDVPAPHDEDSTDCLQFKPLYSSTGLYSTRNTMCQQIPSEKATVPSMYDMDGVTTVPVS